MNKLSEAGTDAKKKPKDRYPSNQKFTKTDMASSTIHGNAFHGKLHKEHPNYASFMECIEAGDIDEKAHRVFHQLIAKAIILRKLTHCA